MQKLCHDIARLSPHPPSYWAPVGRIFMWNVCKLVCIYPQHPLPQTLEGRWSGCFSRWCLYIGKLFSAFITIWSMGNFFFSQVALFFSANHLKRSPDVCHLRAPSGILATLFASEFSWLKVKNHGKTFCWYLHGQLFTWVCKLVLDVASPSVFPQ